MAAPFSFHCTVCFEQFDSSARFPVVLPCGHTYVCNICAEKLDKCMECRTPLVVKQTKIGGNANHAAGTPISNNPNSAMIRHNFSTTRSPSRLPNATSNANRSAPSPSAQSQEPPKRIPLPKNVVLLSLMEATDLATEHVNPETGVYFDNKEPISPIKNSFSDEDEEEKIKAVTSLTVGVCGTYAVAEDVGLMIYPSKPVTTNGSLTNFPIRDPRWSSIPSDEDVDTLVRFFHMDNKLDIARSSSTLGGGDPEGKMFIGDAAVQLRKGDRVQIVSWDGDWAKLARGYGYVKANPSQLVKVGGSVDRACRLEAMLRGLSVRRRELREEQNKVDRDTVMLMKHLQNSLINDEDLTVIGADTFAKNDSRAPIMEEREQEETTESKPLMPGEDEMDLRKPMPLTRQQTPPVLQSPNYGCFTVGEMLDTLTCRGASLTHGQLGGNQGQLLDNVREVISFDNSIVGTPTGRRQREREINMAVHPSPQTLSAGARAWREKNGRQAANGIDFRTGLSGHTGLMSSLSNNGQNQPHDSLKRTESNVSRVGRMSSHMGLSIPSLKKTTPTIEYMSTFSTTEVYLRSGSRMEDDFDNETI